MHDQRNAPPGTITVPIGKTPRRALIDVDDAPLIVQYRWFFGNGYAYTALRPGDGRQINVRMHRILFGLEPGDEMEVDHMNRDRLDNRRSNLRLVTSAQNDQNRGSAGGSSQYRGVCHDPVRNRWRAFLTVNGKQIKCGTHSEELDAARAAEAGRRAHMPFAVAVPELEPVPPCQCTACSMRRANTGGHPTLEDHRTTENARRSHFPPRAQNA